MAEDDGTPPPDRETTAETGNGLPQEPDAIGPYRILQKLGEGGMGVVYLAEQRRPIRRRVALKVIKLGMDTRHVVGRFEAERQALALMSHPNVAKVFDAGSTERGRPYFVMEYVEGEPITQHCDRHRLTTRERLELFQQVCRGVQHAHRRGIIHRDLKPSNILVELGDGQAVPKIIDFGVAKATELRLTERTMFTRTGVMIGTPEYMSPEQADLTAEGVDRRSDVYSLGVLLYELLTGMLPFQARELREAGLDRIRRRIRDELPSRPSTRLRAAGDRSTGAARRRRADPSTLRRQIRGDLDWITMKALEKDRTRRYGSARELADDIERHLTQRPIAARPPSLVYRAARFLRRHRPVAVATGLVLVATIAAAAWLVHSTGVARRERTARAERVLEAILEAGEIPEPVRADWESLYDFIRSESSRDPNGALARLARRAAAAFEFELPAEFGLVSEPPSPEWAAEAIFDPGTPLLYAVQVEASWDSGPWRPLVHGSYDSNGNVAYCKTRLSAMLPGDGPGPGPHSMELRGIFVFPEWGREPAGKRWESPCGVGAAPAGEEGRVFRETRSLGTFRLHLFEEYPGDFPRRVRVEDVAGTYPFRLERVRVLALEIEPGSEGCVRFEFPDEEGCLPFRPDDRSETAPVLGAVQLVGRYDLRTSPPIAGHASVRIEGTDAPITEFDLALGEGHTSFDACRFRKDSLPNRCGILLDPTNARTLEDIPAGTHAGRLSIAPSRDVALETQSFDEYLGTELVLDLPVEIVPTPTERIAERQCSLSILGPCPKGP